MEKTKLNPRTIYWIVAFLLLIGGIFTLNYEFHFQIGTIHQPLSFAHMGAITSGILSMVSFAYGSMKKAPLSNTIGWVHLILSLGFIGLAIYNYVSLNLLEISLPTLESSGATIEQWQAENEEWGNYRKNGQLAYFAFVGLQLIFFVYVFFKNRSN